jgi:uncharacterized protein with HEPN domain
LGDVGRDALTYIEDILESLDAIEEDMKSLAKAEFRRRTLEDAVVRRLEVIGEAVKHVPQALKARYHNIPWRRIAGARDVLIHKYFGADIEEVRKLVKELRELKPLFEEIAEALEE